jgi:hypothetical protein
MLRAVEMRTTFASLHVYTLCNGSYKREQRLARRHQPLVTEDLQDGCFQLDSVHLGKSGTGAVVNPQQT